MVKIVFMFTFMHLFLWLYFTYFTSTILFQCNLNITHIFPNYGHKKNAGLFQIMVYQILKNCGVNLENMHVTSNKTTQQCPVC